MNVNITFVPQNRTMTVTFLHPCGCESYTTFIPSGDTGAATAYDSLIVKQCNQPNCERQEFLDTYGLR